MEIIRKTLKIIVIALIIFIIQSLLLALFIYVTDIKESWSHTIMLALLMITAIFAGILEGKIIGRRVLFAFLITAILFVAIVYGSLYMIFNFK